MRYIFAVLMTLFAVNVFAATVPSSHVFRSDFEAGNACAWTGGSCTEEEKDALASYWVSAVPESQNDPVVLTPRYDGVFNNEYVFQILGQEYTHPRDDPGTGEMYSFDTVIRPWLEDCIAQYYSNADYDGDGVNNDEDPNPLGWDDEWGRDTDAQAIIDTVPESQDPNSPTPWYSAGSNQYNFTVDGTTYTLDRDNGGAMRPSSEVIDWLEGLLWGILPFGNYDGDAVNNGGDPTPLGI